MTRLLVTGIHGPAGRALATQILARGLDLVGVDMVEQPLEGAVLRRIGPASDPGMIPQLIDIAYREDVDLVIPTVSEELVQVSAARHGFHVPVATSGSLGVARAEDKLFSMWQLAAHGVATPAFGVPSQFGSAQEAMATLGRPLVVKPRVSRGGRGVQVLDEPGNAGDWSRLPDGQILQQFAPGQEYAPVVFIDPAGDDDFVAVLRKTALKQGRVGNAVGVERVRGPEVADVAALALAAARALELVGPVDIDVRRLADGTPVVLEVNARFGANSATVPELLDRVLAADWGARSRRGELVAA